MQPCTTKTTSPDAMQAAGRSAMARISALAIWFRSTAPGMSSRKLQTLICPSGPKAALFLLFPKAAPSAAHPLCGTLAMRCGAARAGSSVRRRGLSGSSILSPAKLLTSKGWAQNRSRCFFLMIFCQCASRRIFSPLRRAMRCHWRR